LAAGKNCAILREIKINFILDLEAAGVEREKLKESSLRRRLMRIFSYVKIVSRFLLYFLCVTMGFA
jgi:hypothetical protein